MPKKERPDATKSRDEILRESYAGAEKQLRANHLDEFNKIRQDLAQQAGVEWTPPLTERQKAQQAMAALIAQHPDLLDEILDRKTGES